MISSVIKMYDGDEELNTLSVTYDDGKIWSVPKNPENRHYLEVLEWVAEGNTITDPQA